MPKNLIRFLPIWLLALSEFSLLPGIQAEEPHFVDRAQTAGLIWKNISGTPEKKFLIDTLSGGTAIFDYDSDGWLDIYLVSGNTRENSMRKSGASNALFRNLGNGKFEDVTARAGVGDTGWGQGCVVADYNGDGHLDIYVTNFGPNVLYRNRGDGTFEEVGEEAGLAHPGWGTGAVFADFDKDEDLDLYLVNYVDFDFNNPKGAGWLHERFCSYRGVSVACGPRGLKGEHDVYYRNNGDGTFQDVTAEVGLREKEPLYGFQAVASDLDDDGDLDIFVANDSTPNYLYLNRGDGIFEETALLNGVAYNEHGRAQACMGVDVTDFDNDRDFDLYVTNFSHDTNELYVNLGGGVFGDQTIEANLGEVTYLKLGFGTVFFDFDNDGWKDLFVANGHIYPEVDQYKLDTVYNQENQLFRNSQDGTFIDVTKKAGPAFQITKSSRGAASGDLDNDGDLDLVVVNMDDSVDLLFNESPHRNNWIAFELRDKIPGNQYAVGARIEVSSGDLTQVSEIRSGNSYLSYSDSRVYFGLNQYEKVEKILIRWPDGEVSQLQSLQANHLYRISRGKGVEKVF